MTRAGFCGRSLGAASGAVRGADTVEVAEPGVLMTMVGGAGAEADILRRRSVGEPKSCSRGGILGICSGPWVGQEVYDRLRGLIGVGLEGWAAGQFVQTGACATLG